MGRTKDPSRKRKQNKDPNKPKRSLSAYFFYVQNQRNESAARGEKITRVAEFTKLVSAKWRELTDAQKKPFNEQAAVDKARYSQAMALYKGKDANKPKRPQSAYFLFLAKFRAANKERINDNQELLRQAGEAWKQLTDVEKSPFDQAAQEEKRKYEERMREYNATGGAAGAAKRMKTANGAAAHVQEEEDDEDDDDEYDDDDDE